MALVHYSLCPVCNSKDIKPVLTAKDYAVSGEAFSIWQCAHCTLRFTQDVPDQMGIGPYYASPDYISHSNTDKGLLNKLYQKVRKITLEQKATLVIGQTKAAGNLLDIGAGIGAFLAIMKQKGWEITGIEPDLVARKNAEGLYDISLLNPDTLFQLPQQSFDAVTMWHVLEHVHALQDYMAQLKTLLKENGRIFIAVPNYTSIDAEVYKNEWAAYDVPRHLYHFSPQAMEALTTKHGLKITGQKPMWFDSFYISLLSSKYKHGASSWIGAGLTGLQSNGAALLNKQRCSSLIYIIKKA